MFEPELTHLNQHRKVNLQYTNSIHSDFLRVLGHVFGWLVIVVWSFGIQLIKCLSFQQQDLLVKITHLL